MRIRTTRSVSARSAGSVVGVGSVAEVGWLQMRKERVRLRTEVMITVRWLRPSQKRL